MTDAVCAAVVLTCERERLLTIEGEYKCTMNPLDYMPLNVYYILVRWLIMHNSATVTGVLLMKR